MLAFILLALAAPDLQEKIDRAPSGATIELGAGEISAHLVISKPLTLRGAGAAKTILRAGRAGSIVAPLAKLVVLRGVSSHDNPARLGAGAVLHAKRVVVESSRFARNRGKDTPGLVAIADELVLDKVAFAANITDEGRSRHAQLICTAPGCTFLLDGVVFDRSDEGSIVLGDRGENIPTVTAKNMTWPLGQ